MQFRLRTLLILVVGLSMVFAIAGGVCAAYFDMRNNYGGDYLPFGTKGAIIGGTTGFVLAFLLLALNKFQFQFSIRELALLTCTVAVAMGWWISASRYEIEREFIRGEFFTACRELARLRGRINELEERQAGPKPSSKQSLPAAP